MDFLKQAEEIASTAKFGDLIEFSYPIGYSHWGVYVEDGNVIHFAVAEDKSSYLAWRIKIDQTKFSVVAWRDWFLFLSTTFMTDQGQLMSSIRSSLQAIFPVCGDLLLGETKIRRVPLGEVNVPKGTHALISNNRHAFTPSAPEDMRLRCDALLDKEFPYHLFTLNCEHFATFVRYGKAVCNQIPTRPKNVECVKATATFKDIVSAKETAQDHFE